MTIIGVLVVVILLCFVPIVRKGFRAVIHGTGMGIAQGTHSVGGWIFSFAGIVHSKATLLAENADLKNQLQNAALRLSSVDELVRENADLKLALGRTGKNQFVLAAVLEKPAHSLYDTLIIDGGAAAGIALGKEVYAGGETPIGTVSEVYSHSALVTLYSTSGQKTNARLSPSNVDVALTGEGGGNFSATVPHDLVIASNAVVVTKELNPRIIALFKKVTSDPRDPFQSLLLSAPVNVNELSFVEVKQ